MKDIEKEIRKYGDAESIYNILWLCKFSLTFGGYSCDKKVIDSILNKEDINLLNSIIEITSDPFSPTYTNIRYEDGLKVNIYLHGIKLLNILEKAIQLNEFKIESEFDEYGEPIF